jgi:hypothetical protein
MQTGNINLEPRDSPETQARRIDIFFYGLFMDEDLLRVQGVNPLNRRLASAENFCLLIGARATLAPREGGTVHGVVFSLSHAEVGKLYSQASVRIYRPEAISVRLDDTTVIPALCFNLPTPPASDQRNPEYAAKLRALAERIGLPSDYVSSIK